MAQEPVAVKADGKDCTHLLHDIEKEVNFDFTARKVTYYGVEGAQMLDHELGAAKETETKLKTEEAAIQRDLDKLDAKIEQYDADLAKLHGLLTSGEWASDPQAFKILRDKVRNEAVALKEATNSFCEQHGHRVADLVHELEAERNNIQLYADGISDGTNLGTTRSLALAQHVCDPALQRMQDLEKRIDAIQLHVVSRPQVDLPYWTITDQIREINQDTFNQDSADTLALSISVARGALSMLTELNEPSLVPAKK